MNCIIFLIVLFDKLYGNLMLIIIFFGFLVLLIMSWFFLCIILMELRVLDLLNICISLFCKLICIKMKLKGILGNEKL